MPEVSSPEVRRLDPGSVLGTSRDLKMSEVEPHTIVERVCLERPYDGNFNIWEVLLKGSEMIC